MTSYGATSVLLKNLLHLFALLALLCSSALFAENSTSSGGYTIHHNALSTEMLLPDVAKAYGIKRSKQRGLLNIAVIKDHAGTAGIATTATITVKATNLIGQLKDIQLREVREGNAIYYISDFPVANRERINFILTVKPTGATRSYTAKLNQEFYID
jgi:hypothetical protein